VPGRENGGGEEGECVGTEGLGQGRRSAEETMRGGFIFRHGAGDTHDRDGTQFGIGAHFRGQFTSIGASEMAIQENQVRAKAPGRLHDARPAIFFVDEVTPALFQDHTPEIGQVDFVIHQEDPVHFRLRGRVGHQRRRALRLFTRRRGQRTKTLRKSSNRARSARGWQVDKEGRFFMVQS